MDAAPEGEAKCAHINFWPDKDRSARKSGTRCGSRFQSTLSMTNFSDPHAHDAAVMFATYTNFKDSRFGQFNSQDGGVQESVHRVYSQYASIKTFNEGVHASWTEPQDVISTYLVDSPIDVSSMSTPDLSRATTPGSRDYTPFAMDYFPHPYAASEATGISQPPLPYSSHAPSTIHATSPSDSFPPSTITPFGGDYHSAQDFGLASFDESGPETHDQPDLFSEVEGFVGFGFAEDTDTMYLGTVDANVGATQGDVGVDLSAHLVNHASADNYEDIFDELFTSEPSTPPMSSVKAEDMKPIVIPSLLPVQLSQPRIEVASSDHEMDFEQDTPSSPSSDSSFPSPRVTRQKAKQTTKSTKVTQSQKRRRGRVPIKDRHVEASTSVSRSLDFDEDDREIPSPTDSTVEKKFWPYRLSNRTIQELRARDIPEHWFYRRQYGPCRWRVDGKPCGSDGEQKSRATASGDHGRHLEKHVNQTLKIRVPCKHKKTCGKDFSREDAAKRHMRICHGSKAKARNNFTCIRKTPPGSMAMYPPRKNYVMCHRVPRLPIEYSRHLAIFHEIPSTRASRVVQVQVQAQVQAQSELRERLPAQPEPRAQERLPAQPQPQAPRPQVRASAPPGAVLVRTYIVIRESATYSPPCVKAEYDRIRYRVVVHGGVGAQQKLGVENY
ncbi:hypothetical protein SISNIDRAFT_467557 [Sistotremastrum niveocremeum HHB9708]|uniref:C2H2-type domain-containing protein n=1 Tax=Sistotremastrum niveocremeum HHB9708 TaxID=1314777 RepID=A0A164SMB8_9AGAM|nr:hypothetical protein SISNIDRAFT_467557 [Sistotremastrum niveocremeum HHB9708]